MSDMALRVPASVRQHIRDLRAAGAAFHAIAAELNRRGWRGPAGGRWFAASVRRQALLEPVLKSE